MQAVLPTKGQSSSWIETAWQLAIKCSQLTFSLFSQDRGFAGKQISVSFVIITDVSNISPSAVFSSSEKALLFSDASWSWIEARITLVWISSTQKLRLFTHYDENILCASYSATIIRTNHHHHFHHDGLGEGLVGQQFPGPHSPLVKNHSLSSIFLTTGRDDRSCWECCLSQYSPQKSSTAGWSESMDTRILLSEMVGALRKLLMVAQFLLYLKTSFSA